MSTVHLKKARAGSDSRGNVWPEDGAVIEVDYDHALVLLAIPDGGFSVADKPEPAPESESDGSCEPKAPEADPESESGDSSEEVSEVAPEPEPDATPDKPAPRRGGRPRKTVEEG